VRRTLYAGLSFVAVLFGTLLAPGAVAPAAAGTVSGACTSSKGVTVVVNFASLGGGTVVFCDASATSSTFGLAALQSTGLPLQGANPYGLAFICQISGLPKPDSICERTPPADAYWSYWHASNGSSWTYSTQGVSTHKVTVGGFEGWRFYNADTDGKSAVAPTSGSPTRPPAPPVPTEHLGPAAAATATPQTSKSATPTTSASKTASPTTSATPTASDSATPTATSTAGDVVAGGQLPGDDPPAGGGSPLPFVLGAVGILLVLGGAGLIVARRRAASGP
jgi:hypothetical protein